MNEALTIKGLTTGYGKKEIIKDLTLSFEKGRLYALIGPNGSGKSTLLRTILKETRVFGGNIEIEGKDLAAVSQEELSRLLSLVPQKAIVPEGFTVEEVLEMAFNDAFQKKGETIRKALAQCGIEELAQRRATELSGGELQLVLLARCLATDSPLILLDEPSSSLDIRNQSKLLELAKELTRKNKTIIMIVHDLNAVLQYADEVVVLKDGSLYSQGEPKDTVTEDLLRDVFQSEAKLHETLDGRVFIG